ncbi:MAG: hypothetical protein ACT4QD_00060 [Acidobacteriota bacterium]
MNALAHSRVAEWVNAGAGAVRRALREGPIHGIEPPLDSRDLSGPLATSTCLGLGARVLERLETAVRQSATVRFVRWCLGSADATGRIGLAAWTGAVASAVHLVLLMTAERYPFPSRASLVVPMGTLILSLTVLVLRRRLAAALEDRSHSG